MKLLPLLIALSLGLAAVAPAVQASTLIGTAWDTPLVFPQQDSAPIVKSGRTGQTPQTTGK
ncbi:hypothetical protein PM03_13270 [Thalassobacter stenotrophicus]|uniref:hypothetical protein n=1 Tax=Thalassobacter TaxID=266808 RepID=UPI00051D8C40|nr:MULTISPECIES: hypothetical protein [Thalassobacter]KGK78574.1 hypothetical protein PM03_13270 [Thalassobacter stenotrophicus]KGL00778.1 hypothetical protein PM04_13135 [Thalassobacter sp. 16PALIMAR09]